jgi:NAD(P)H-hydrate epimerase
VIKRETDLLKTIPAVTREQMIEIDRGMVEDFGLTLLQGTETSGRHLATLARDRFLAGDARERSVVVLAGAGGKGGGALAAARRLANWGARVEVFLVRRRASYEGPVAGQLAILDRLKVPVRAVEEPLASEGADVLIDGMVGYGLRGRPKSEVADAIRWANAERMPVLALDLPTGMDATTGAMSSPALKAVATLALGLPKTGLLAAGAEEFRGELYLGDVGVPEILYRRAGIRVGPIFSETDLLRLG